MAIESVAYQRRRRRMARVINAVLGGGVGDLGDRALAVTSA